MLTLDAKTENCDGCLKGEREAGGYIKRDSNWVSAVQRPAGTAAAIGGAGNRLTGHGPRHVPGQRNSPAHLPAICAALAELMNITPEQLANASTANCCEVFGW